MKLYVRDWGWQGGLCVMANSAEEALILIKEVGGETDISIEDLEEYLPGQVAEIGAC